MKNFSTLGMGISHARCHVRVVHQACQIKLKYAPVRFWHMLCDAARKGAEMHTFIYTFNLRDARQHFNIVLSRALFIV